MRKKVPARYRIDGNQKVILTLIDKRTAKKNFRMGDLTFIATQAKDFGGRTMFCAIECVVQLFAFKKQMKKVTN